jgi:hypothetical protein
MTTLRVKPLVGVGDVRLGAPRDEVLRVLGPPEASARKSPASVHPTDAWMGNGLQIHYAGAQPTVHFIEISSGAGIEATVFGVPIFSTDAAAVMAEIKQYAPFDDYDPQIGFSYVFASLELNFSRHAAQGPDAKYFSSVGVGVYGYFSR